MILVTGATGRVGFKVVETLCSLNLPVTSLVRKGSEYYWLNETGCKFFFGDLRDAQSLSRALNGVQFLVVCSGVQVEERENNHVNVTIDGHRALFEAAVRKGIQHVVLVSCQVVETDRDVSGVTARRASEEALQKSGLSHTILRASPHEFFFMDLAWRIREKGKIHLPANGDNNINPIPTRDLAMIAAASLDLASAKNQVIQVGGAETMTAGEALNRACRVAEVTPNIKSMPGPIVQVAGRIGRGVRRFTNRYLEDGIWFTEDFQLDGQKMATQFNIPLSSFDDALVAAHAELIRMSDPDEREKRMVHPQFYATVYEPGEADLADLPAGPPPRRD